MNFVDPAWWLQLIIFFIVFALKNHDIIKLILQIYYHGSFYRMLVKTFAILIIGLFPRAPCFDVLNIPIALGNFLLVWLTKVTCPILNPFNIREKVEICERKDDRKIR